MLDGIKLIDIQAETRYPIVSAYEFEFLKGEEEVKERLKGCTVYCIVQRPLMWFQNITMGQGVINFEILDGINKPLVCRFDLAEAEIMEAGGLVQVEIQYYKDEPDEYPPYMDVAAFKILSDDGKFILWETPQKFLYEVIVNGLPADIEGDIEPYLEYHVHYIGKAWSQEIWERLTGHEKLQKILTLEDAISLQSRKTSFEIAILLLDIVGFDEANLIGGYEFAIPKGVKPILFEMKNEEEMDKFFNQPIIKPRAPELTSEVEALLIHLFRPQYNDVLFQKYPNITKGTRSVGYTSASLTINRMPVLLKTEYRPAAAMGDMKLEMEEDS
ncbi:hypothetical protein FJ986_22950 [Mesorhizobium sp. B1-1-1]|uniref:hypothetical protein n=1 Tax=Mesorhizobium sp. B1-1-1 TaxID=2589983 RepID=UPI0011269C1D|nr:hypothetical protein [Mesorhizobium sp. B1-1-1]TPN63521.1 hypothetical protein FJ986_22950 [Mesorhizobium sp. B1-1-1]